MIPMNKNGSNESEPVVIQVKDLVPLLLISHNTAYELVRSGRIRSIRIGRSYRIPREAVTEYLSKHG